MKYIIEDYNIRAHKEIDTWIDEKKYKTAKLINKFALFNEPLSDFYKHILDNPNDLANIKSFIKVFKDSDNILGVVVFHYYVDANIYYLGINPLIVNPSLMNKRIGTNILKIIVKELKRIFNDKVDFIVAKIDETNHISIKLFEGLGFRIKEKDENFTKFIYQV
ncbi:MAG: GNAT family N-acetyltransferase [Acholeplasmatales bacterium]